MVFTVGAVIDRGASPSVAVIGPKLESVAATAVVPATTELKVLPAHAPSTVDQLDPLLVERSEAKVGAGFTPVVDVDGHFHPMVPPALPVTTMK